VSTGRVTHHLVHALELLEKIRHDPEIRDEVKRHVMLALLVLRAWHHRLILDRMNRDSV